MLETKKGSRSRKQKTAVERCMRLPAQQKFPLAMAYTTLAGVNAFLLTHIHKTTSAPPFCAEVRQFDIPKSYLTS